MAAPHKNETGDGGRKAPGVWLKRLPESEALLIQDQPLQLIGQPPVSQILTLHGPKVGMVVLQGPDDPLDFLVIVANVHRRFSRARIQWHSAANLARPFQRPQSIRALPIRNHTTLTSAGSRTAATGAIEDQVDVRDIRISSAIQFCREQSSLSNVTTSK